MLRIYFGLLGVAAMGLTERRKQFLQGLVDLYHRTSGPVHYETLAHSLGVSKWTAYDMLKELEKQGLLTRDYTVHPGEAGRSQVVFLPTSRAEEMFAQPRMAVADQADLMAAKNQVLQRLAELKSANPAEIIQTIMAEIHTVQRRVEFCAYLTGVLLIHLHRLGPGPASLVHRLVRNAPRTEMRLVVFVGTVVGTVIDTVGQGVSGELADLVGSYLRMVAELTEAEREMLIGFLEDGLSGEMTMS